MYVDKIGMQVEYNQY